MSGYFYFLHFLLNYIHYLGGRTGEGVDAVSMGARGQVEEVGSPPPPYELWTLSSGHEAWHWHQVS